MTSYTAFSLDKKYEELTDEQLIEMSQEDKTALELLLVLKLFFLNALYKLLLYFSYKFQAFFIY